MFEKTYRVNLIQKRVYSFEIKAKTDKKAIKKAQEEAKQIENPYPRYCQDESETWEAIKE